VADDALTMWIPEAFRAVVAAQPGALALVTATRRFTYADIDRWSDEVAAGIPDVARDRPIAIVTRDSVALVPAMLGVVKAGHFFVMIDAADPQERIDLILRESGAVYELTPPSYRDVRGSSFVVRGSIDDSQRRTTNHEPRTTSYAATRSPNPNVYVVYTSGTTGKPKAVMTKHEGFVERNAVSSKVKGLASGERTLLTALPGFTRASLTILGSLLSGATMCAFDARSEGLDALAELIRRERVTTLNLPPALFRKLMTLPGLDLSSVRVLRLGADRITLADVELFKSRFPRGAYLQTGFASTETGRVLTMRIDHDTPVPGPLVPMGRPMAGVEVRLVDEEGNDADEGELVVRGESVVSGYWNDPELTARHFVDGAFHTGDLARRDAEGLYYFVGRKDARLKIRGRRIDPSEVEAALLALGGIRDAVVVGKRDQLVAYVVIQEGAAFDARHLRAAMRAAHPAWMVPAHVHALASIPITRAAKADRAALTARVDEELPDESGAGDELEAQLATLWAKALGRPVHVHDDFLDDLGGDSIVAAQLVSEVQRATSRTIPLSMLLELNTVASMAAFIRAGRAIDPVTVAVQPRGSRRPLFCIAGAGGSVMIFRRLARALGSEQPLYGLHHHGLPAGDLSSYAAVAGRYAEAIRRIQSRGPYYLAGYSSGGILAFELARQFQSAGEEVAFVGLIDTAVTRGRSTRETRLANRLAFLRERPLERLPRYLWEMLARRPWFLLERRLRRARFRVTDFLPDPTLVPDEVHAANEAFTEARRNMRLLPYAGPVALFRARHGAGAYHPERDLGWRTAGVTDLRIHDVEGDHRSVLEEDVASLARAFVSELSIAAEDGNR
jgi:amino acid adenylation domain-containing protein